MYIWKMANVCILVTKLFTLGLKIYVIILLAELYSLNFFSYAIKTNLPKHFIK